MGSYLHPNMVRVLAYIPRRYNSAAEATSLLSSVSSLATILGVLFRVKNLLKWAIIPFFRCSKILGEAGKQEIL